MGRVFCLVLLSVCVQLAVSTKEQEEHAYHEQEHHNHDHPEGADTYAFDHEVFLGSRVLAAKFAAMNRDEAKDKLLIIAQEMDINKDGSLSKDELAAALEKNFLALDKEEATEKIIDMDDNKDKFVDWAEYVKNTYNVKVEQLEELAANTTAQADPHVRSTVRTYRNDQLRFKLADTDGDGKLDLLEFTAFTHPYDFPHMLPAEVQQTIESYDVDGDGTISISEYLRDDASGSDAEWRAIEESRFKTELDKNKDGILDANEVNDWISPSLQSSAQDEASHLMNMIDSDQDGVLSQDELMEAYQVLVGAAEHDETEHQEL